MSTAAALNRLELRVERLHLKIRFTYAFHAREVRFELNDGSGYARIFPETFSFHASRHDPAELYIQFEDLAAKPRLLSPRANRRDAAMFAFPGRQRHDRVRTERAYQLGERLTGLGDGRAGLQQYEVDD